MSTTSLPVSYLVVVKGEASDIARFSAMAQNSAAGRRFFIEQLLPVPSGIREVDPYALPYYFFLNRQMQSAALAARELEMPLELCLALEGNHQVQASAMLTAQLDEQAKAGVHVIRKNFDQFLARTPAHWKDLNWGSLRKLREEEFVETAQELRFRFSANEMHEHLGERLSEAFPELTIGMVAVKEVEGVQYCTIMCESTERFERKKKSFTPGLEHWLDSLPDSFFKVP